MPTTATTGYLATATRPAAAGEMAGELFVEAAGLCFRAGADSLEIPFARLAIAQAGNRVRFTDNHQPGWVIYTREDRILSHPQLVQQTPLRESLGAIRQSLEKRAIRKVIFIVGTAFLAFVLAAWLVISLAANWLLQKVPPTWESELGRLALAQMGPTLKKVNNARWEQELEAIVKRLKTATPNSPYTFQFQVIDDPDPNAFALPGGQICVHSGLLEKARSPEEVAGVLAHEMAHVNQRHGLRQIVKTTAPRLLIRVFVDDQQGFLTLAADSSQLLLQQNYSRAAEREADALGWQYLLDARIDPRGMIGFFQTLEADPKLAQMDNAVLKPLRSHPLTRERIEYLQSLWDALPKDTRFEPIVVGK